MLTAVPAAGNSTAGLDLGDYRGKVVVLDFWASWCVPCRRSFPWMNAMQQRYGDDGLVVIAVNLDNEATAAAAFLQRYPPEFSVYYDNEQALAREFGVAAMPCSFLIDRDGNVVERQMGFKSAKTDDYEAAIVALLASP